VLTPEEMQAVRPLPAGWLWFHDDDGWLAESDECDKAVWVSDGQLWSADSDGDTDSTPLDIALAVILANKERGSLESAPPAPRPMASYQALAQRTAGEITPAIAALGLAGEAGEVADLLKKHLGHGHPLDVDQLRTELGDVLWYIAALCTLYNITLDSVAAANIDKLRKRYPDGFSHEASRTRSKL